MNQNVAKIIYFMEYNLYVINGMQMEETFFRITSELRSLSYQLETMLAFKKHQSKY